MRAPSRTTAAELLQALRSGGELAPLNDRPWAPLSPDEAMEVLGAIAAAVDGDRAEPILPEILQKVYKG